MMVILLMLLKTGTPCDKEGWDLEPGALPPSQSVDGPSDWAPFDSQVEFETADFLFKKVEMSQGDIDVLMQLWASTTADHHAPFKGHEDMLAAIDSIQHGEAPWHSFSAKYSGNCPSVNPPNWMVKEYTVYYCNPLTVIQNILSNPSFKGQFDYSPYEESEDGVRRRSDLMSGDWAWKQAVSSMLLFMFCSIHKNHFRISLAKTIISMGQ